MNSEPARIVQVKDFLRSHPFEVEDASWFPPTWRSLMTDYLRILFELTGIYNCVVPNLVEALKACRQQQIIDECSGSGGPIISLTPLLSKALGLHISVTLTDKFPPHQTDSRHAEDNESSYYPYSADATDLPKTLEGFRTLFTSFHHFTSSSAKKILADAVAKGTGIGIFEVTQNDFRHFVLVMLTPLYVLLVTPFLPFSLSRLLWTYIIPVIPFFAWWDGIISNFRSYSENEVRKLVADFTTYEWSIGTTGLNQLVPVRFLLGRPKSSTTL